MSLLAALDAVAAAGIATEGITMAAEPSSHKSTEMPTLATFGITGGLAADAAPMQSVPNNAGKGTLEVGV